jgi:hypothetical protein
LAWSQQGPVLYVPPIETSPKPMQQPQTQQIEEEPVETRSKGKKVGLIVIGVLSVLFIGTCGICVNSISKSSTSSVSSATTNTASTAQESTYLTNLSANAHNVNDAMQSITEMCLNPKLGNAEWEVITGARIGALQLFINQGRAITAPPRMMNIQNKYIEALDHFYTMTEYLDQGIKKVDSNLINRATVEMNLGNTCMDEATELVKNFKP